MNPTKDPRWLYAIDVYKQPWINAKIDKHTEACARFCSVSRRYARKFLRFKWKLIIHAYLYNSNQMGTNSKL